MPSYNIAKWDGVSKVWSSLSNHGIRSGVVHALAIQGSDLYVAGNFNATTTSEGGSDGDGLYSVSIVKYNVLTEQWESMKGRFYLYLYLYLYLLDLDLFIITDNIEDIYLMLFPVYYSLFQSRYLGGINGDCSYNNTVYSIQIYNNSLYVAVSIYLYIY